MGIWQEILLLFNRQVLRSHKSATGSNAWAFRWGTPANYVGDITFYITTISGDSSVTPSGDTYCVSTLVLRGAQPPANITADFSANNTINIEASASCKDSIRCNLFRLFAESTHKA